MLKRVDERDLNTRTSKSLSSIESIVSIPKSQLPGQSNIKGLKSPPPQLLGSGLCNHAPIESLSFMHAHNGCYQQRHSPFSPATNLGSSIAWGTDHRGQGSFKAKFPERGCAYALHTARPKIGETQ